MTMGLNLSVYVGPYLEVTGGSNARLLLESFDDVLTDGRGENGSGQHELILIPNQDIGRQASFDKYEEIIQPIAIAASKVQLELEYMRDMANTFIAAHESTGGKCEVLWGVVCGMF
jgi:hypothetical protein